jgi:hypothetical protein
MLEVAALSLLLTAGTLLFVSAFPRHRDPDRRELAARDRLVQAMKDDA